MHGSRKLAGSSQKPSSRDFVGHLDVQSVFESLENGLELFGAEAPRNIDVLMPAAFEEEDLSAFLDSGGRHELKSFPDGPSVPRLIADGAAVSGCHHCGDLGSGVTGNLDLVFVVDLVVVGAESEVRQILERLERGPCSAERVDADAWRGDIYFLSSSSDDDS